jgi:hypothetical protein
MLLFYAAMTEDLLQAFHTKASHLLTPSSLAGGASLVLGPTKSVSYTCDGRRGSREIETAREEAACHSSLEEKDFDQFTI